MAAQNVWFGTANRMAWVPAPLSGVDRSLTKWRVNGQFLNGGAWSRSSASGSRKHVFTWPAMLSADIRQITTYFEGTYGRGLLYYVDPFAQSSNMLPQWLAVPSLACDDAPVLYGTAIPTEVTAPANTYSYPTTGALYNINGVSAVSYTFPVPPNMTANVGFHGAVTGSAVLKANATTLTPLAVTTSTLTNFTYTAPSTGGWVTLAASGVGTLTAYGLHMSIGTAPTGDFVKGEGFTGLRLVEDPQITGYSAGGLDRQAVSATLQEVGAWE